LNNLLRVLHYNKMDETEHNLEFEIAEDELSLLDDTDLEAGKEDNGEGI